MNQRNAQPDTVMRAAYVHRDRRVLVHHFFLTALMTGCAHFSPPHPPVAHGTGRNAGFISYQCESGRGVQAIYRSGTTALVRYANTTHEMPLAISASGARYIGGGLEWWTKGSGPGSAGTLFRHENDGTGEIVEQCVQASGG